MNLPPDIAIRWMTYDPAQAGVLEALLSSEERERVAGRLLLRVVLRCWWSFKCIVFPHTTVIKKKS